LSKQTGIAFIYAPESITTERKLSFHAKGRTLGDILRYILAFTDLTYLPSGRTVVIRPRKAVLAEAGLVALSGFVRSGKTGETLPNASIFIPALQFGTVTNENGFYTIQVPKGSYWVEVSHLGYTFLQEKVEALSLQPHTFILKEKAVQLDTLYIVGARDTPSLSNQREEQAGRLTLHVSQIRQLPTLMGEADVLKALTLYPGVQHVGEGNISLFVRGGAGDQNLLLLDDAPVYNAAHLLGFFSSFNTDIIREVGLYKSGIPVQYGGRLSSLLDVRTREGNRNKPSISGGLGNLLGRIALETPFADSTGTLVIAGRRTYLDWLFKTLPNTSLARNKLFFYDINIKATWQYGKGKWALSLFQGEDQIRFQRLFGTFWKNQTASLRYTRPLLKGKVFSQSVAYITRFKASSTVNLASSRFAYQLGYQLQDAGLKQHFTGQWAGLKWSAGGALSWHRYLSGQIVPAADNSFIEPVALDPQLALEQALYASAEGELLPRLQLRGGLRYSRFSNIGPAQMLIYGDRPGIDPNTSIENVSDTVYFKGKGAYHHDDAWEPRVYASYQVSTRHSVTLSYDRTVQYLHQLANTNTPSPINMWALVTPYIPPQRGHQVAWGWLMHAGKRGVSFSVEAYTKRTNAQLDFKPQASLLLNNHLETEVLLGNGWAYGLELLLKKDVGVFKGWLSYTLSDAKRQIRGINQDQPYPASFNRRHHFSAVASYLLNKRFLISANWMYASGIAYTFPVGKYEIDGVVVPYYTSRNGFQLEPVHRLDLSLTIYRRPSDGQKNESNVVFSIYNAYARKNTYAYIFRPSTRMPGLTETVKVYLFSIVPSFSYNFYF
jgi:hypothetical protein